MFRVSQEVARRWAWISVKQKLLVFFQSFYILEPSNGLEPSTNVTPILKAGQILEYGISFLMPTGPLLVLKENSSLSAVAQRFIFHYKPNNYL